MFRFPIALAVGLTAAISAAQADTIIIQGSPTFDPAIIAHGPMPDLFPGNVDPLMHTSDGAFVRLTGICEMLDIECGEAGIGATPAWTPGHIADAQKRLSQMAEDREALAEALEEHFDALPVPHVVPAPRLPSTLFGWTAPYSATPHIAPRPRDLSRLFPQRPGLALPLQPFQHTGEPFFAHPRTVLPAMPSLQGFHHRLNTPGAVIPHSILPRAPFAWHLR